VVDDKEKEESEGRKRQKEKEERKRDRKRKRENDVSFENLLFQMHRSLLSTMVFYTFALGLG